MFTLRNDLEPLKFCSLTCKALFVSARHITHRKTRLTQDEIELGVAYGPGETGKFVGIGRE